MEKKNSNYLLKLIKLFKLINPKISIKLMYFVKFLKVYNKRQYFKLLNYMLLILTFFINVKK